MNQLEFPPQEVKKEVPSSPIQSPLEAEVRPEDEVVKPEEELTSKPERLTNSEDDDGNTLDNEEAREKTVDDKKEGKVEIDQEEFKRKVQEKAMAESKKYFEDMQGAFSDLLAKEEKVALGNKFEELLTTAREGKDITMDNVLEKFGSQFAEQLDLDNNDQESYSKLIAGVVNSSGSEYLFTTFSDRLLERLDPKARLEKAERDYNHLIGYYFDNPFGQERLKEIEESVEKELRKAAEGQQ